MLLDDFQSSRIYFCGTASILSSLNWTAEDISQSWAQNNSSRNIRKKIHLFQKVML